MFAYLFCFGPLRKLGHGLRISVIFVEKLPFFKFRDLKFLALMFWHVEPLLCNDGEMDGYTRAVSGQWVCKQIPSETNTYATIEVLLDTSCSVGPCRDYKRDEI